MPSWPLGASEFTQLVRDALLEQHICFVVSACNFNGKLEMKRVQIFVPLDNMT